MSEKMTLAQAIENHGYIVAAVDEIHAIACYDTDEKVVTILVGDGSNSYAAEEQYDVEGDPSIEDAEAEACGLLEDMVKGDDSEEETE